MADKANKEKKIISLGPTRTLFDKEEKSEFIQYKEFLNDAFSNERIYNIAITGAFGVGKSSIIRSFEAKDPNKKNGYLYISLADFDAELNESTLSGKEIQDKKHDLQQEFERYLLCQILARSSGNKMPQSTYRLLPGKYHIFTKLGSTLLIAVLFGTWFLIARNEAFSFDEKTLLMLEWIFVIAATFTVGLMVFYFSDFFKSLKLSAEYKSVKVETDNMVSDTGSYIDDNIFEIVYALERLSKSIGYTVVLEDFDRLGNDICIDIFSKMRRINLMINDRKIIKEHIRFIYAFDDSIFELTKNTKFFDYILSVTPQLNTSNAGLILKNRLINSLELNDKNDVMIQVLNEYDGEFWMRIGLVVNDYRTLNHIQNEFVLFLNIIRHRQEANNYISQVLDEPEKKYLPYIIYKNVMPDDYIIGLKAKTILEIDKEARNKRIDILYGKYDATYTEFLKSLINYLIDDIHLLKEYYYAFTGITDKGLEIREESEQINDIKRILQYKPEVDNEKIGSFLENNSVLVVSQDLRICLGLIFEMLMYKVKQIDVVVKNREEYTKLSEAGLLYDPRVRAVESKNLLEISPLELCVSKPDVAIFVGSDFYEDTETLVRDELIVPFRLLKRCVEDKVRYFLYCSNFLMTKSFASITVGTDYKAVHSIMAELTTRIRSDSTVIKTVNLYGDESEFEIFKGNVQKQIELGGPVRIGLYHHLIWSRALQNVCHNILKSIFIESKFSVYIFDRGKPIMAFDLAKYLIENAGYVVGRNMMIINTKLKPGQKLYEEVELINSSDLVQTDDELIFCIKLIQDDLQISQWLDQIELHAGIVESQDGLVNIIETEIKPIIGKGYMDKETISKIISDRLDQLAQTN